MRDFVEFCLTRIAACLCLVLSVISLANGEEPQFRQRHTRALTRELIVEVLDSQLQQLAGNQLQHVPLYSEIQGLRQSLDSLAAGPMLRIEQLLAESSERAEAPLRLAEARDLARRVVVEMMVERQRIRKRLQIAQASSTVANLIRLQTQAREVTGRLESRSNQERDALAIDTFHDQQDINSLIEQLEKDLAEIAGWGGAMGESSAEALERCRRDQTIRNSELAATSIGEARYHDALSEQQKVLSTLYGILHALDRAQGLTALNLAAARRLTTHLQDTQEALRADTGEADLSRDREKDSLAARQQSIERELSTLANTLESAAMDLANVEAASSASRQAEQALFEGNQSSSVDAQQQILESLASIAADLNAKLGDPAEPRAASDLGELEQLDQQLDRALDLQAEVNDLAAERPDLAAAKEDLVREMLQAPAQDGAAGETIQQSVASADDAIAAAQQALRNASEDRMQATEDAEQALWELAAQVKSSLDNQRSRDAQSSQSEQPSEPTAASDPSQAARDTDSGTQQRRDEDDSGGTQVSDAKVDSRSENSDEDTSIVAPGFADDPWFAKLPPEIRKSILSKSRGPAPRGYEERLRKYFQRID